MKLHLLALALLSLSIAVDAFCAPSIQAQSAPVATRVLIHSFWGGYSPVSPLRTEIVIFREGSKYRLTGTNSRGHFGKPEPVTVLPAQPVPVDRIERLLSAMMAPARPQVDPGAFGLSDRRVQQAIDGVWHSEDMEKSMSAIRAGADAFRSALRQPGPLAAMLTRGFSASHSDDYPHISVEVVLADGSKLSSHTDSQQFRMLPWTNAAGEVTYSTDISRALWALLPADATNRDRLNNKLEDFALGDLINEGLSGPLNRFVAEAQAGAALKALEAHFKVVNVAVTSNRGEPKRLAADLQLPGAPTNLVLSTRLALTGNTLANGDRDIARIAGQLTLVQSSPTLVARMRASPRTDFHVSDGFGWTWLNAPTAAQFVQQMDALHKLPELATQPALMRGAALVTEGRDPNYWIVLSDHRTVLWKRFIGVPVTADPQRCASVPVSVDDEPQDSLPTDLCLGTIYDANGDEVH
jgi:hypothetical protein